MPNLSIKDVPEAWAEALRERASRHHRSLQRELMAIIEQAVTGSDRAGEGVSPHGTGRLPIVGYDSRGWPIVRQGTKTPEEIFARMRASGSKVVRGQPLAVDILRKDRDSR